MTDYTPTPKAVEAAAKRLAAVAASYGADGGAEAWRTWTEEARAALTAAGPIIAAEALEAAAAEIVREADRRDPDTEDWPEDPNDAAVAGGLRLAARIARGEGS